MKNQHLEKLQFVISFIGLCVIFLLVFLNSQPPLFDEVLFVRNMELYNQYGLSTEFLINMYDQAPGPLYQIVHGLFEPITKLQMPYIRLVNFSLFILVIVNLYFILKLVFSDLAHKWLLAMNIVIVPVVWQVAGMALTEMPAIFFATLAFIVLALLIRFPNQPKLVLFILALAGGICMGGAIIGRTPYLLILLAVLPLIYNPLADKAHRFTIHWTYGVTFLVTSLAVCLPVFYAWEGLIPPHQRVIAQGDIQLWFGVLGFAYAGVIVLLVSPEWFKMNSKIAITLGLLALIFTLLNIFWWNVEYQPVYDFLSKSMPPVFMRFYPYIVSPILMVFSAYFILSLIMFGLRHRNNSFLLAIILSVGLVLCTCVSIKHQFSSRYVAQIAPFLIIVLAKENKFSITQLLRFSIGIALGFISLQTYINP